jgi:hypothetical protein
MQDDRYGMTVGQAVAMTFTFPASKEIIMATGEAAGKTRSGIAVEISGFFKD